MRGSVALLAIAVILPLLDGQQIATPFMNHARRSTQDRLQYDLPRFFRVRHRVAGDIHPNGKLAGLLRSRKI